MELPTEIREQFRRYGREGGRARATKIDASERRRIARLGATKRWLRARFGVSELAELSLPGAEIVDRGLADLAAERTTEESLLVSIAGPRLRREGIAFGALEPDPERRLYEMIERTAGDLAHARYTARVRRIASFADGCRLVRIGAERA